MPGVLMLEVHMLMFAGCEGAGCEDVGCEIAGWGIDDCGCEMRLLMIGCGLD
jgi:hypothetical protein